MRLGCQTLDSFMVSLHQACLSRPNRIFIYPLNILRGTQIWTQAREQGYEWDTKDYNLFTQSQWMKPEEVRELKGLAQEINRYAKSIDYGEKGDWRRFDIKAVS